MFKQLAILQSSLKVQSLCSAAVASSSLPPSSLHSPPRYPPGLLLSSLSISSNQQDSAVTNPVVIIDSRDNQRLPSQIVVIDRHLALFSHRGLHRTSRNPPCLLLDPPGTCPFPKVRSINVLFRTSPTVNQRRLNTTCLHARPFRNTRLFLITTP